MKITIETPLPGQEDEIVIRVAELTEDILDTVKKLKNNETKDSVAVISGDSILMLQTKDIFYFDSVDDKVFAYTKDKNYEIKMKLYEIEEDFSFFPFSSKFLISSYKAVTFLYSAMSATAVAGPTP